ncbi:MAG: biopolymer transporter ExbD [Planctomycetes bacterium]|nr:biopolymer transporter ExbD [Planctomycetota bacterium]
MFVPHAKSRPSLEFNMTPMIDVTFLLIIFFLVSGHLAHQETQLELELPKAASGHKPDDEESTARRVTINVLDDGQLMLAGQPVDPAELERRIGFESRHAEHPGQEVEVRIRCHRAAPYRAVEPILLACARGGIWKVTFAVLHRDGSG